MMAENVSINVKDEVSRAAKTLGATPDLANILTTSESILAPRRAEKTELVKKQTKFEADTALEKARIEQRQAEKEVKAIEEKRKNIKDSPEFQASEKASEDYMKAGVFVPTRDNANSLAAIFAIINIAGFAMGSGGKRSAQAAMSGMNGMLEGYQKGRADLYKKERDLFLTNYKALENQYRVAREKLADLVKREDITYSEKVSRAKLDALTQNADFLAANLDRAGIPAAIKTLDDVIGKLEKTNTFITTQLIKERDVVNKAEEDRKMEALRHQYRMKEARAKVAEKAEGTLKPGAKVTEAYIADNQLKADIDDLAGEIRRNPRLTEMLKQYRIEAFLSEEGKVLNQLVDQQIPSELRSFLTKVRDMRNNYYLNISGKAVTGGEALRSYGTVPQPGDSPQAMIDKMNGMSNRVSNAISIKRQLYGLPTIKLAAGAPTNLVPGETYSLANPQTTAPTAPTTPDATKVMPTGERLAAYAKTHFGGDEAKAKAHLSSQGYK